MAKYRKKTVAIEAVQLTQHIINDYIHNHGSLPTGVSPKCNKQGRFSFTVTTIHGQETNIIAEDWVMPEPDGKHFYPCKPDIFEATYEKVEE